MLRYPQLRATVQILFRYFAALQDEASDMLVYQKAALKGVYTVLAAAGIIAE